MMYFRGVGKPSDKAHPSLVLLTSVSRAN